MKSIVLISLVFFLSCNSNLRSREATAKQNIKKYLSTTMNDFKSYEPVSYGKIDSIYKSFKEENYYQALKFKYDNANDMVHIMNTAAEDALPENTKLATNYLDSGKVYMEKISILSDSMIKFMSNYNGPFVGYQMVHTFRGKNSLGATILTTETFMMDSNLVVLGVGKKEE